MAGDSVESLKYFMRHRPEELLKGVVALTNAVIQGFDEPGTVYAAATDAVGKHASVAVVTLSALFIHTLGVNVEVEHRVLQHLKPGLGGGKWCSKFPATRSADLELREFQTLICTALRGGVLRQSAERCRPGWRTRGRIRSASRQ